MQHSDYYFKFLEPISDTILTNIKNNIGKNNTEYFCQNGEYPDTGNTYEGVPSICKNIGIKVTDIPVLNELGFIKKLRERFSLHKTFFLEILPNYFFTWHRDFSRSVSIIIPLHECHGHTLFAAEGDGSESTPIVECKYSVGRVYALNTKVPHCVFNLDNVTRYCVSIGLGNMYKYHELMDYCLEHNLIDDNI